jgi:hypothetical protein
LQSDCATERVAVIPLHHDAVTELPNLDVLPIPRHVGARTIAIPDERGPGHWVGAPSVLVRDGVHYLAYRRRRPVDDGRGGDVIVARVAADGALTELCRIDKAAMDAESLERPALVVDPAGRWRLYLSCATTGTRHWRVELLEAGAPDEFVTSGHRVVMPGDVHVAMKDPVVLLDDRGWRAWICCHPLDDPDATDRMWTEFATSDDGIDWALRGPALQPSPGRWDQRGTRVTSVIERPDTVVAFYDGRANAAENWEERTGVAVGSPGELAVIGDAPVAEAPGAYRALRYACVVDDGDRTAVYYETGCDDGSHELRREWFPRRPGDTLGAMREEPS